MRGGIPKDRHRASELPLTELRGRSRLRVVTERRQKDAVAHHLRKRGIGSPNGQERHHRTLEEGARYQDGVVVREAGSERHPRYDVSGGGLSFFRIRFRVDESGEGNAPVLDPLLESEHEAIHGRAPKACLGSLKVQQNGDLRRPRVVMFYLGGGDRWTDRNPKECENQDDCRVWTIHGVLLLEYLVEHVLIALKLAIGNGLCVL